MCFSCGVSKFVKKNTNASQENVTYDIEISIIADLSESSPFDIYIQREQASCEYRTRGWPFVYMS